MTYKQIVDVIVDDIMDNLHEEDNLSLAREALLRWVYEWTDKDLQVELKERGLAE